MRLNGKHAIMRYLGRAETNQRAWQAIKLRYGRVIYTLERTARKPRYWVHSEALDTIDRETGYSVYDLEYDKLKLRVASQALADREGRKRMREKQLVAG